MRSACASAASPSSRLSMSVIACARTARSRARTPRSYSSSERRGALRASCAALPARRAARTAASAMTVPGPKIVRGARRAERRVVVRRNDAADDDEDVGAAERRERRAQRGDEREVPGGERARADDVDVVLDRGARRLLGRLEERARCRRRSRDRRTPSRSPSGRGRARPAPSWRRGCAAAAPRARGTPCVRARTVAMAADVSPTSPLYTPEMARISAWWRPHTFSSA